VKLYWQGKAEVLGEERVPVPSPSYIYRDSLSAAQLNTHRPRLKNSPSLVCRKVITDYCDNHKRHMTLWAGC